MAIMVAYPPPLSRDELTRLADAYMAHTGTRPSTLGRIVCGNDKFFQRISQGLDCRMSNAERATDWFHANWPPELAWPSGVSDLRALYGEKEDGATSERRRGRPAAGTR